MLLTFLSLFLVVIQKNKFSQALQGAIEGFPVIGLGKLINELNQIGVPGDHECSYWYIQLATANGEAQCPV